MKSQIYPILNLVGLITVLVVNYLAVALPLNGNTPGEISDLFPTLFTPAGFTFLIWNVIYLLLIVFVTRQIVGLFRSKEPTPAYITAIGPLFFINCLLNAGWLFAWHHLQIGLSFLIMLGILSTLILIYIRLNELKATTPLHWTVTLPFSIYLGWITVATIVNAAVLLYDSGWDRFGASEELWTVVMLAAGTIIGLLMLIRRRNIAFGLVLAWAYFGIYMKASKNIPTEQVVLTSILAAIVILLLFTGFTAYTLVRTR